MARFLALLIISMTMFSCGSEDTDESASGDETSVIPIPQNVNWQIINEYPHDTLSFTEGLVFHRGVLYESTGAPPEPANNGTWIGAVDLKTGSTDRKVELGKAVFGEGITFLGGRLYQLTYKSKKGFVYDAATFGKLKEFPYASEGWGMTHDGTNLIMSTGSSNLYYLHPDSLTFVRMLPVQDNTGFVNNLNELEFIDGFIYANQWLTPMILKIDPASGYVVGRLDLSRLVTEAKRRFAGSEELNGIAYDSAARRVMVTGKKWPVLYEIRW